MDIQIRRVRRRLLWERAYEARTQRGHEKITERAKTPELAQALVEKRCFAKDGLAMTNPSASDRSSWGSHHHYPSGHAIFCRLCEAEQSLFSSAAPIQETMCCSSKFGRPPTTRRASWGGLCRASGLARLSPFSFWSCCYILAFADQCVGVLLV